MKTNIKKTLITLIFMILALSFLRYLLLFLVSLNISNTIVVNDQNQLLSYNCNNKTTKVIYKLSGYGTQSIYGQDISNKSLYISYGELTDDFNSVYSLLKINMNTQIIDTLIKQSRYNINEIAVSPDSQNIALLLLGLERPMKKRILFWDIEGYDYPYIKCAIYNLREHSFRILPDSCFSWSKPSWAKDGNSLWLSTFDGNIINIDLNGNIINQSFKGYSPALSNNGKYLAYIKGRTIYIYNLKKKNTKTVASYYSFFIPHRYPLVYITWSPNDEYILYQGQHILSYITGWSSYYVATKANGLSLPQIIQGVTSEGFGAVWVP